MWGALERGDGASLQALTQRVDALDGVGAFARLVEAAELIARQAAQEKARERWHSSVSKAMVMRRGLTQNEAVGSSRALTRIIRLSRPPQQMFPPRRCLHLADVTGANAASTVVGARRT